MEINDLSQINVVCSNSIGVASTCVTYRDKYDTPKTMCITIALDAEKVYELEQIEQLEAAVYIPAEDNFHSIEHYRLLNNLENEPFSFVQFKDLMINMSANGKIYCTASSFAVTDINKLEELTL